MKSIVSFFEWSFKETVGYDDEQTDIVYDLFCFLFEFQEIQQQINLERRLKRRSWKAYLKLMKNPELGAKGKDAKLLN